jgi:EAL domain-containing protein (putative c-di-GMP-specific phosphodiesterase class I)
VQAVDESQFVVHYQPRVNALDGALTGCEALVRWAHPVRGLVYPGEFIALAEESGLILRLGELVLDQVCRQLVEWRTRCLAVIPVSVNVSAKQFNEGGVAALFASYLQRYDLPPSLINVELTESATANNPQQLFEELAALHALGISVHLDDFGTGYSSLATLHRLDVDVLKVDRAFTAALGSGEEGQVFFKAIISMAKSLGIGVIAEGVERATELRVLQQLGCDEIQGYLIAKPLAPEELQAFCMRERDEVSAHRAVSLMTAEQRPGM